MLAKKKHETAVKNESFVLVLVQNSIIFIDNQMPQLQKLQLTFLCMENIILGYNFIIKTLKEPVT